MRAYKSKAACLLHWRPHVMSDAISCANDGAQTGLNSLYGHLKCFYTNSKCLITSQNIKQNAMSSAVTKQDYTPSLDKRTLCFSTLVDALPSSHCSCPALRSKSTNYQRHNRTQRIRTCSNVRQWKTSAKYTEVSGFKSRCEDGRFWLVSFLFFFSPSKFRQRSDSWRWHHPAAAMLSTDSSQTPTLLPQVHALCPKFPSHELYWGKLLIMVTLRCPAEGWRISLMTC